jgi:hypothetical protein
VSSRSARLRLAEDGRLSHATFLGMERGQERKGKVDRKPTFHDHLPRPNRFRSSRLVSANRSHAGHLIWRVLTIDRSNIPNVITYVTVLCASTYTGYVSRESYPGVSLSSRPLSHPGNFSFGCAEASGSGRRILDAASSEYRQSPRIGMRCVSGFSGGHIIFCSIPRRRRPAKPKFLHPTAVSSFDCDDVVVEV